MPLTPDRYADATLVELLAEASLGRIGVDHAWVFRYEVDAAGL